MSRGSIMARLSGEFFGLGVERGMLSVGQTPEAIQVQGWISV